MHLWCVQGIEGHSVNTYTLVNSEGKENLVKFHWLPVGGAQYMNDEEASPASSHALDASAWQPHAGDMAVASLPSLDVWLV